MGTLKPGVTYIYERVGNITYAREAGSSPDTRFEIGRIHDATDFDREQDILWAEIRKLAKNELSLQAELDRVIMLYYLIKDDNKEIQHHSV
jgi:hypothetical protein